MKTTLLLLSLFTPLFIVAQKINYPTQLQNNALLYKKAKVKTIKSYEQVGEAEKQLVTTTFIDKKGFINKIVEVLDEETTLTTTFEYNNKGQLLRKIKKNSADNVMATDSYVYGNDKLIHEKHDTEEDSYTINYTHNNLGQVDSSFIGSAEFRRNVWTYDSKGQLQSILGYTIYDFDTPDNWVQVDLDSFVYDNQGLVIKTINCYSSIGCFVNYNVYNNAKQKISSSKFQKNEEIEEENSKTIYEYNSKGLLISEKTTVAKELQEFMPNNETTHEYSFY